MVEHPLSNFFSFTRWLIALLVLTLLGCKTLPITEEEQRLNAFEFQDGDIVLSSSNGPAYWILALSVSSQPEKLKIAYSHAEMVFTQPNGEKMLGGVFSRGVGADTLENRLDEFARFVVFRAKKPKQFRNEIGQRLFTMVNDPVYQQADFDFTFQDVPGRKDKFFCLGLLNEIHREFKLSVPFPYYPGEVNPLAKHFQTILNADFDKALEFESIFNNPTYNKVFEWENSRVHNAQDAWLAEHIARYTLAQYYEGWQLRELNEFNLLLAVADISQELDALARIRSVFREFIEQVSNTWKVMERRGQLDDLSENEKLSILSQISDKYREEYFIFVANTADK